MIVSINLAVVNYFASLVSVRFGNFRDLRDSIEFSSDEIRKTASETGNSSSGIF